MHIVCLDLEGVLVPEIWIAFSEASGIPELKLTTRDEPDYDKLMKYRIKILKVYLIHPGVVSNNTIIHIKKPPITLYHIRLV